MKETSRKLQLIKKLQRLVINAYLKEAGILRTTCAFLLLRCDGRSCELSDCRFHVDGVDKLVSGEDLPETEKALIESVLPEAYRRQRALAVTVLPRR